MITTGNYINFKAHIKRTDELTQGFDFARQELDKGKPNYGNYLANSINLYVNDNTNDVYEVRKSKNEDNTYILKKNGKQIYSRNWDTAGKSIVFLLADQATYRYNKGIVTPLPEGNDTFTKCENVRKKLDIAESLLED